MKKQNHLKYKDINNFALVAIAILEDIKIALKEKPELTFKQLKERLFLEIKDIAALFSK